MQTREDDLIESLYRSEYVKLLGYAQKWVGKTEPAQDLVQDTFHEAVQNADALLSHPNPQGWLMQTLKYKLMTYERDRARYAKLFVPSEAVGEIAAPGSNMAELMQTVKAALTPQEFDLFERILLRGDSHLEVASELGITVWACQKRVSRVKEKLKKEFPEYGNHKKFKLLCQLLLLAVIHR